jgi:hypothetical protein
MTCKVNTFSFKGADVRILDRDGEPWWVAVDVGRALGLKGNGHDLTKHLDGDEKGAISNRTLGGNQRVVCVNESGLWALVLQSRKPEAKEFRKWATSEVIPSIRKTGAYSVTAPQAQGLNFRFSVPPLEGDPWGALDKPGRGLDTASARGTIQQAQDHLGGTLGHIPPQGTGSLKYLHYALALLYVAEEWLMPRPQKQPKASRLPAVDDFWGASTATGRGVVPEKARDVVQNAKRDIGVAVGLLPCSAKGVIKTCHFILALLSATEEWLTPPDQTGGAR